MEDQWEYSEINIINWKRGIYYGDPGYGQPPSSYFHFQKNGQRTYWKRQTERKNFIKNYNVPQLPHFIAPLTRAEKKKKKKILSYFNERKSVTNFVIGNYSICSICSAVRRSCKFF